MSLGTDGTFTYLQAVKHLVRAAQSSGTEDSESIQLAIDVAAAANDDGLTRQLIDFLMGEVDGIPKVRLICNFLTMNILKTSYTTYFLWGGIVLDVSLIVTIMTEILMVYSFICP